MSTAQTSEILSQALDRSGWFEGALTVMGTPDRTRNNAETIDRVARNTRVSVTDEMAAAEIETTSFPESALADIALRRLSWDQALARVRGARTLCDDWDYEGAIAPTEGVISTAESYIKKNKDLCSVAPDIVSILPSGAILIAWERSNGETEIEISEPEILEIMRTQRGMAPVHEELPWPYSNDCNL